MTPFQEALAEVERLRQQNERLRADYAVRFEGERAGYMLQINMLFDRLNDKNRFCNQLMHERMDLVQDYRELQDKVMALEKLMHGKLQDYISQPK
jgi:predicted nuclease with TOPRIM domain